MKKYEFKVVEIPDNNQELATAILNNEGLQGWGVVGMQFHSYGVSPQPGYMTVMHRVFLQRELLDYGWGTSDENENRVGL